MRRFALFTVSALALSAWAAQPADAARVCKEVCDHGVCNKSCVREEPVRRGYRERDEVIGRGYRDREIIERRHERRPGFEVDTPVGDVRIR
jgi:hypothetical protein